MTLPPPDADRLRHVLAFTTGLLLALGVAATRAPFL